MKVTILIKAINRNKPFCLTCGRPLILYVQDMMPQIALCCLEGSTMSNLAHRRRRCARIVMHSIPCLEGSTPEDGSGAIINQRYSLWLQGSLFCTANGSYFALWLSVYQGQTRRVGRFRQASLLALMNINAWLQGRKPRESNKLFDLFPLQANPSYPW